MKNLKKFAFFAALVPIIFFASCDDKEDGDGDGDNNTQFQAVITELNETYSPNDTITLDLTGSTGVEYPYVTWTLPAGVTYNGTLLEDQTTIYGDFANFKKVELVAGKNGSYNITARLEQNGMFSEAYANTSVAGSITLTTVPEGFIFQDISYNDSIPDYIFVGDIIIPNVTTAASAYIVISIEKDATTTVEGTLDINNSCILIFRGKNKNTWKGLLVTGDLRGEGSLYVNGAGASAIGSYPASAMVIDKSVSSYPQIFFENTVTDAYDIHFGENVSMIDFSSYVAFASNKPIHAPISLWNSLSFVRSDGLMVLESDINTVVNFNSAIYLNTDIFIKGGLNTGVIRINGNKTIYMEENTAFITGGGQIASCTFDGYNNSTWQGIYIGTESPTWSNVTINNAGSNFITSGNVNTNVKAAVYATKLNSFKGCTITNSGGYGLYTSDKTTLHDNKSYFSDNTFTNNTLAAVSVTTKHGVFFASSTFTTPTNIAAIEVRQGDTPVAGYGHWTGLGTDNFYHFTGNLNITSQDFIVDAGANFKFNVGKGIYVTGNRVFNLIGTSTDSVIIEGTVDDRGTWMGIFIQDQVRTSFDYASINNGGGLTPIGALNPANVIINSTGTISATNSSFNSSNYYGVLIQSGATSLNFEDINFGNTFSNNLVANFLDKNAK